MKSILRLLRFLFWWIVVLITVAVIGFFLWPLFSDKARTLKNGDWDSGAATSDVIQMTLEQKIRSFFDITKTAARDVMSDDSGKIKIIYDYNRETGDYISREIE